VAVPLFVMVSGACLLPRRDTYRQAFWRFVRVLLVLILFSYGYYLVSIWQDSWAWSRALDAGAFLKIIWSGRITDAFWYLYFYLGMMVMLPVLQRLAAALGKRDLQYFMAVSFGVYAAWPLLTHYVPEAVLPHFFDLPLFSVFLGLFFAGHYVQAHAVRISRLVCLLAILAALGASVWLTYLEYGHVASGVKYWFMDERTAPSVFVVAGALAAMLWAKASFARRPAGEAGIRRWAAVGGTAFGIYLLQDLLIAESRYRFFVPMSKAIDPLLAALIWEIGVFAVAFAIAWLLKRVPLLKRLL
jgi:surface polysaccharide O-acyltransferase-like enzyme